MANTEQAAVKIDARAYPIAEPKSNTVAFASVTINDMIAINGIRVVSGEKGLFVAMPQTKDAKGEYRDICFPVTKELRQQLNKTVLDEYAVQKEQPDKSSVKDQIKDGSKAASDKAPAAKNKSGKDKANPDH